MTDVMKLALRVYIGTSDGVLDKHSSVSVGDVPNEFKPMPPALVDESDVWMITHAQQYTLYALSSKRFRTVDNHPGQMQICLFLPPHKRLADGHSPLELLDALMDCFVVQGVREGKFSNVPIDNAAFMSLLGNYRLEDRPMDLPIMGGHESYAFCVESKAQLDAIMRHSRYPILSSVGRLELGFSCKSTIALMTHGSSGGRSNSSSVLEENTKHGNTDLSQLKVSSGGLPLDEGPIEDHSNTFYKKLLVCIAVVVVCCLTLLLGVSISNNNAPLMGIHGSFCDDSTTCIMDTLEYVDTLVVEEYSVENDPLSECNSPSIYGIHTPEAKEEPNVSSAELDRKKTEAEEMAKKKAEEARKKAEEMAKKKAEEARKKKEAENAKWQSSIRKKAQSCPVQLRLGVRIASITSTSNSVTITVNYEELSKYDLDSYDESALTEDVHRIYREYCTGLPSGIRTNIIQKDRAGRILRTTNK